jgi:hypothetical protein
VNAGCRSAPASGGAASASSDGQPVLCWRPLPAKQEQRGVVAAPAQAGSHEGVRQPADGLGGDSPSALVASSIPQPRLAELFAAVDPLLDDPVGEQQHPVTRLQLDRSRPRLSVETEWAGKRAGKLTDDSGTPDPQRRRMADVDPGRLAELGVQLADLGGREPAASTPRSGGGCRTTTPPLHARSGKSRSRSSRSQPLSALHANAMTLDRGTLTARRRTISPLTSRKGR